MQNQSKTLEFQPTIRNVLSWTASYFQSRNIASPKADAAILLAHALNMERIEVYLQHDKPLCPRELEVFKSLIKRRILREPVAYIVGTKGFWTLDLAVTKDVLIPRPETEFMVEAALSDLPDPPQKRVLELGTGSGAVVIALASERPGHIFFASDRSVKAIEVARKNAARHGTTVHFFCGDWFKALSKGQSFDMILSNPPYIRTAEIGQLQPEICKYEPFAALDGGKDGLGAIRHILSFAPPYLAQGGSLLLETGHDQKAEILKIIAACGCYELIAFIKDYGGHDRIVHIRKKYPA
jgi:release factor glutamine methyltransferase